MKFEAFVTCAVTGSGATTDKSPHVPVTPEQIAEAQTAARDFFDSAAARAPQTPQVVQTTAQDQ